MCVGDDNGFMQFMKRILLIKTQNINKYEDRQKLFRVVGWLIEWLIVQANDGDIFIEIHKGGYQIMTY